MRYALDKDGGFTVDDGKITAYAYPTSPRAVRARKDPVGAAIEMQTWEHQTYRGDPAIVTEYDARNRARLDAILGG